MILTFFTVQSSQLAFSENLFSQSGVSEGHSDLYMHEPGASVREELGIWRERGMQYGVVDRR